MAEVVKFGVEVGQVVAIDGGFRLWPLDFAQALGEMEANLDLGGSEIEASVPAPAIGTVEAAAMGGGVAERAVHDVPVGSSENELVDADAGEQVGLAKQAVVGGAFEIEQSLEISGAIGQAGQDAFVAASVAGRNKTVSGSLTDVRGRSRHLQATPACIEPLPDTENGGEAAFEHVGKRAFSGEHGVGVSELDPGIGEFAAVKNVQALEDSQE